ncbi:MAG: DUF389 domain-containing protein [Bacteroidales bacterium]|nr:DUF389 domain-containing protein [Bacteroidales bacterium]
MNIKEFFSIKSDLSSRQETIENITNGTSFRGATIWILICAIFIASLGLNVNSTAVIIGAMLVSPLMGPIIAMGMAVGINDLELLKRAAKNYLMMTVVAIMTATLYFFITPFHENGSELLARTSPTLYDVLIAFFGGAAGIIALSIKDKGNVIPGVAIATALMPPLCTAGFGIASGSLHFFAGALYLYFINTVFIALSTFAGVRMMKFKPREIFDEKRRRIVNRTLILIVVLAMVPAFFMTINIIHRSIVHRQVRQFIHEEANWEGTRVVADDVVNGNTLRLVLVGRNVNEEAVELARHSLTHYSKLKEYDLEVVQGADFDSIMSLGNRLEMMRANEANNAHALDNELKRNAFLTERLNEYERYEDISNEMRKEVNIFFPQIIGLSLSSTLQVFTDSQASQRCVTAIVDCQEPLSKDARERLHLWFKEKTVADSLRLIVLEK